MKCVRAGIALVVVATAVGATAMAQGKGGSKETPKAGGRAFYLTTGVYNGGQAQAACAPGFYMASVYELLDASTLRYDTTLGYKLDDSGGGPPSGVGGWVRTGGPASPSGPAGFTNCLAYTSALPNHIGTSLMLRVDLTSEAMNTPVRPWFAQGIACDISRPVWCIQD